MLTFSHDELQYRLGRSTLLCLSESDCHPYFQMIQIHHEEELHHIGASQQLSGCSQTSHFADMRQSNFAEHRSVSLLVFIKGLSPKLFQKPIVFQEWTCVNKISIKLK